MISIPVWIFVLLIVFAVPGALIVLIFIAALFAAIFTKEEPQHVSPPYYMDPDEDPEAIPEQDR